MIFPSKPLDEQGLEAQGIEEKRMDE